METDNNTKLDEFVKDVLIMAEDSKEAIKNKSATSEDYKLVQTVFKFAIDLAKAKAKEVKEPSDIKSLPNGPKEYAKRLRDASKLIEINKLRAHNKSIILNAKAKQS